MLNKLNYAYFKAIFVSQTNNYGCNEIAVLKNLRTFAPRMGIMYPFVNNIRI